MCLPCFLYALDDDLGVTLCVYLGTDLVDDVPVVVSDIIRFARITAFLGQTETAIGLILPLTQPSSSSFV